MSSMYVFTRKWGSPICHVLLTVQNTHWRALLIQRTIYWIFTETKVCSIYRHDLYFHLLGLDKISSVPYNSDKTRTCNYFVLLLGRDRLWRNPRKRNPRFLLKRCYIQIYPTSVFCRVMEKLLFFNICGT